MMEKEFIKTKQYNTKQKQKQKQKQNNNNNKRTLPVLLS